MWDKEKWHCSNFRADWWLEQRAASTCLFPTHCDWFSSRDEISLFTVCVYLFITLKLLSPPPPIINTSGYIGITLSTCPSICLSFCLCPSLSRTGHPFLTKHGIVVYYYEAMFHAELLVHYLQCQGHSEGLYIKIWLFLLYLLNW